MKKLEKINLNYVEAVKMLKMLKSNWKKKKIKSMNIKSMNILYL